MNTLGTVVFLGKFLVSQKLGAHASCVNKLAWPGLFDAIGMSLLRVVMRTRILRLSCTKRKREKRCVRNVKYTNKQA
jgi:hypothetical protein